MTDERERYISDQELHFQRCLGLIALNNPNVEWKIGREHWRHIRDAVVNTAAKAGREDILE